MSKFTVDGVEYEMVSGPDDLTFSEGRAVEKVTGTTIAQVYSGGGASLDFMQALAWISMKRVNQDVTFDDLDDMKIGVFAEPEPEDPTEGDGAEKASPSAD